MLDPLFFLCLHKSRPVLAVEKIDDLLVNRIVFDPVFRQNAQENMYNFVIINKYRLFLARY